MHFHARSFHLLQFLFHPFGSSINNPLAGRAALDISGPEARKRAAADATVQAESGETWNSRRAAVERAEAELTSIEEIMLRLP
jgi:hypothetical protein